MSRHTIRRIRQRLRLSQQDFARRLGVARATVTRWENGSRRPSRVASLAIRMAAEVRETKGWLKLAGAALDQLWDNPEDTIYDDWQACYPAKAR